MIIKKSCKPISEALVDGRLGGQLAAVTLTAKDGKPVLEL